MFVSCGSSKFSFAGIELGMDKTIAAEKYDKLDLSKLKFDSIPVEDFYIDFNYDKAKTVNKMRISFGVDIDRNEIISTVTKRFGKSNTEFWMIGQQYVYQDDKYHRVIINMRGSDCDLIMEKSRD